MQTAIPENESPSMCVLDAVAEQLDADMADLNPPLYSVVDPDALDQLLRSENDVSVQFEYLDHSVLVGSDGSVSVDGGRS